MTELERGYIAGIIDGQGSITLCKNHMTDKYRHPEIEITSTTLEILERVKEINNNNGTITKVTKQKQHHKQAYRIRIAYDKALNLLQEIKDYLLEPKKKYRAELLVNEYKKLTPRNGKYSEQQHLTKMDFENRFFLEIV